MEVVRDIVLAISIISVSDFKVSFIVGASFGRRLNGLSVKIMSRVG